MLKRKNIYSSDNYNYEQKIVKTHFYKVNEFEKKNKHVDWSAYSSCNYNNFGVI